MKNLSTAERWVIILGLYIVISMIGSLQCAKKQTQKVKYVIVKEQYDTLKLKYGIAIDSIVSLKRQLRKIKGK